MFGVRIPTQHPKGSNRWGQSRTGPSSQISLLPATSSTLVTSPASLVQRSRSVIPSTATHQVPAVVCAAFVENGDDVDVEAAALEVDADAVLLLDELVSAHVRVGLEEAVGEPRHQLGVATGRGLTALDIHSGVEVVHSAQRRALGHAARVQHLHQAVGRIGGDLLLQALAQGLDLRSVLGATSEGRLIRSLAKLSMMS